MDTLKITTRSPGADLQRMQRASTASLGWNLQGAAEALAMGLVHKVVALDGIDAAVESTVAAFLAKRPAAWVPK